MAEQTLLQLTQDVLSHLNSDEVNSISDTVESMQVATIIKNKYYDIASRGDLTEHDQLFQLNPSNDDTNPVFMLIPDGISSLEWVKYFNSNPQDQQSQFGAFSHGVNTDIVHTPSWITTSTTSNVIGTGNKTFTVSSGLHVSVGQGVVVTSTASSTNTMNGTLTSYSGTTMVLSITSFGGSGTFASWTITGGGIGNAIPGYQDVEVISIRKFIDMVTKFNPSDTNVKSYTFTDESNNYPGNFTLYYKTDRQPKYCSVFSNFYALFDSFDSTQDSTLQASKTMCFGQVVPLFVMDDDFIPDLDDQQFPLLLNEAKALAYFELKQTPHIKAEQEIKRQWASVQSSKAISKKPSYFDQLANFGRRIGTGGYALYKQNEFRR